VGRIIVAAFLLLAVPIAFADTLTGKVVKVVDGDTITVLDHTNTQHRIRLPSGIAMGALSARSGSFPPMPVPISALTAPRH
jgi:hypothetical protein